MACRAPVPGLPPDFAGGEWLVLDATLTTPAAGVLLTWNTGRFSLIRIAAGDDHHWPREGAKVAGRVVMRFATVV